MSIENEEGIQEGATPATEIPAQVVSESTTSTVKDTATPEVVDEPVKTDAVKAQEKILDAVAAKAKDLPDVGEIVDKSKPNPHVTLDTIGKKLMKPTPEGKEFPAARLATLMATAEHFRQLTGLWKKLTPGDDAETLKWLEGLSDGINQYQEGIAHISALADELGDWRQSIDAGDTLLNIATAGLGDVVPGRRLSGELAQQRMTQSLRLGAMVSVPLFHTGIWLTLKAPSEDTLLLLEEELIAIKIAMGRNTGGRTHSAQGVYAMGLVIDAILNCVYDGTTQDYDAGYLKSIIKVTDLHPLVLGFLSAIYPGGYAYSRVCVADPSVCKHVTEEVINLGRLLVMNRSRLTEKQKAHMRRRKSRFTPEEIKAYQDEFGVNIPTTIELNDRTKITLRVPTLQDADVSGREWIDDMLKLIDSQSQEVLDEETRNRRVANLSGAQTARQYSHWVERITLDGDFDHEGEVIENRRDVAQNIGAISGNDELEKAFYEGVEKFIGKSTMALVAIPDYECPKCGKHQANEDEALRHPNLIPLDTIQTFFTLLGQKAARIRSRRLV
ncbi:MAG TPA: hypothetical protein VN081_01145 [Dongiaceae bacterium]|nr:hypothetical protein [Dongiaceae bacterium]